MKIIIIINLILTVKLLSGQVTQEWVATYNGVGVGQNVPKKNLIDKLNNIIVAGRSENLSFNDDFIILKYNSSGNLLWQRRYNGIGNGDDAIAAAVLDDSDNIYVTGYSQEGTSLGGYNWVTIKYFPNGDTAWKRSFNWTANTTDEPFAMAIDKFNNIYISGYGRTGLPFDDDFITIKYNSNGIREWVNVYASVVFNTDMSNSIVVDDSCNVYPSGYGSKLTGNEIITIKYSTTGEEKWIRRFPTNYSDILRFTLSAVDKYNNVILNGYYYLGEQYAFNTIKYNSSGDLLWNRIYKGDGNLNFCFALCTDDSANVYAAGRNTSTGTGNDFLTIKYNQYGDTSWIRIYDGGDSLHDEIKSIAVDNFENVFVTGVSQSSTIANMDYLTIKYNSYGDIVWKKKYNGVGMPFMNDISYAISIDNNGSVIISGNSELSNTNSGFVTLEYSFITNTLENIQSNYSFSFLLQNYPNPFNPITNINYQIAQSGFVTLKIYNLLGKEIETLINEEKYSGKHIITFNGSNYSSGIYCYSLYFNNTILDTKRMLLIK